MELVHTLNVEKTEGKIAEKGLLFATKLPFLVDTQGTTSIPQLRTSGDYYTAPLAKLKKGDRIVCELTSPNQAIGKISRYEEYVMIQSLHKQGETRVEVEENEAYIEPEYIIVSATEEGLNIKCEVTTITSTTIEEPIGYDDLQVSMERHEYHGIGAEASLSSLEFYGIAAEIISEAYNDDIEKRILYKVKGQSELEWLLDLSTYCSKQGKYTSVSCKVCEEGIKTIFNNRTDTDIDLNTDKTIDGAKIEKAEWQSINIPTKHLLYTNNTTRQEDEKYTTSGGEGNLLPNVGIGLGFGDNYAPMLSIPVGGEKVINEFGTFQEDTIPYTASEAKHINPQYVPSGDHEDKYGVGTEMEVDIKLDISMQVQKTYFWVSDEDYITWQLVAASGVSEDGGDFYYGDKVTITRENATGDKGKEFSFTCKLNHKIPADKNLRYYLLCDAYILDAPNLYISLHATVHKGSYVKMKMYDCIEEKPTYTDVIMVKDALDVVSNVISENKLQVKSDWYSYKDTIGGGAQKALTNGYKMRDLFTDGDNERNMPVSFKSLITNLSALDCIGWGFSKENGQECLRVERWDWFYQDEVMLELKDAEEILIETDTDRMITELVIGYKKYTTSDQYNSIDSPHGVRVFANSQKVISNSTSQECEFIADNYSIEEARRTRYDKSQSEESSYDSSIFVLEVVQNKRYIGEDDLGTLTDIFLIQNTSYDETNIGRAEEFINAKLTPRHMAARWKDYLFQTTNRQPLKFTSGEINYKSKFAVIKSDESLKLYTLQTYEDSSPQSENEDIAYVKSKLKAEKITFSYPISVEQYKIVKNNPYGIVEVNGLQGWIKTFKYSFADGMAEFTLIPKNTK